MRDVFWDGFIDELSKLGGDSPSYRKALARGGSITPGGSAGAYAEAVRAGARSHHGSGMVLPPAVAASRFNPTAHRKILDAAGPSTSAPPAESAKARNALARAANATDKMRAAEGK